MPCVAVLGQQDNRPGMRFQPRQNALGAALQGLALGDFEMRGSQGKARAEMHGEICDIDQLNACGVKDVTKPEKIRYDF